MDEDQLPLLAERIGVPFRDIERLRQALTHRSAATQSSLQNNERLEFLGDSVVGLIISETLYQTFPSFSEGDLAKSKSYIVSEAALAQAASALGLDEFVVMSTGEAASGGRRRRSILADAFEALVAAIYLDRGIVVARRFVRRSLAVAIQAVATDQHHRDYKSSLQERTQAALRVAPKYRIVDEIGDEHDKTFIAYAYVEEMLIGKGNGKSKKEAEQAAAQEALGNLPALLIGRETVV